VCITDTKGVETERTRTKKTKWGKEICIEKGGEMRDEFADATAHCEGRD